MLDYIFLEVLIMKIPEKLVEGAVKLRDRIISNSCPHSEVSSYNRTNSNIILEYYNDLSHIVLINVRNDNDMEYRFTGIIENDSLNSQINVINGSDTCPSCSKINIEDNTISINRKFTGLNTLYMIEPASFHRRYHNISIDNTGINITQNVDMYSSLKTLDIYTNAYAADTVSDRNKKIVEICNNIIDIFKDLEHVLISYSIDINSAVDKVVFKIDTKAKYGISVHSIFTLQLIDIYLYDNIECNTEEIALSEEFDLYYISKKRDDILMCIPLTTCLDNNIDKIECYSDLFEVHKKDQKKDTCAINKQYAIVIRRKESKDGN